MDMKKILINTFIITLLAFSFSFFSCKNEERKNNISNTELKKAKEKGEWELIRSENDLFSLDTSHLAEEVKELVATYPPYFFVENCWEDKYFMEELHSFLRDPEILDIYNDVTTTFPNSNELEAALKEAFAYYLVYFPNDSLPDVITSISGINLSLPSVYAFYNTLVIYIDLYLGGDYAKYDIAGMPKYISERCDKKYIAIDCFKKALVYKHISSQEQSTLLDAMIFEGKKLVFTEYMVPNAPIEDIIGYTSEQYQLASTYYGNVWNHIIEKGELYSTSSEPKRRYIQEAPFTKPFGNQAPGRMGQFIGWQIVKAFMEKNPETTLSEMMKIEDASIFLKKGNFKPRAN